MKTCFKCGAEKPLTDFYKHPAMADGHLNKCKDCTKSDSKENRAKNVEYYRAYDAKRFQDDPRVRQRHRRYQKTKGGKQAGSASKAKWINKNPEARAAHILLGNAVRNGRISKPDKCSACDKETKSRNLHGHHEDYAKPLEVIWLCAQCHVDKHKDD